MARAKTKTTRAKAGAKRGAAKTKTRRRSSKNTITVDFTGVESGGGMPTPDGYYIGELRSVEEETGQESGESYLAVRWKTNIGSTVFDNFSLQQQSLWVLRTMLECAGYEIPDGEYSFEPEDLVGIMCGLEIVNEEYEDRDRPRVTGYMTEDVAKGIVEESESEEEEEESDDAEIEDPEEEEPEPEEEEEEGEEEEEEEEPAPPKSKAKSKAKAKKKAAKKPAKKPAALRPGARVTFYDGEDELQGVIEYIEDGNATVVDTDEVDWEIPVTELTKA